MASRNLNDLDARLRPLADQWIAACEALGVPVTIITTLRTSVEQHHAVETGVSWTLHSKHLPQPPEGKSLAIDLCPTELLTEKGWAPASPLWWTLARCALDLGLRSGMDWHGVGLPLVGQVRPSWDPGHAEYVVFEG
jgi:hypothetical protein